MPESENCKFTRKELERLNCTDEEVSLVMEYQKRLPILLDENNTWVDLEILYKQLGVKKDFTSWVKQTFDIINVDKNEYELAYIFVGERKNVKKSIYSVKLSLAKEIAMMAGARGGHTSVELKENSKIARRYFILMERIVKDNKEWLEIRDPEKEEYKKMSKAIDAWCFRIWHHNASRSEFAVEADGINKIVTGKTSKELKSELKISTFDLLRDYLKKDHNEELLFLERQNQVLLAMDMGFTERMNMLAKMHEVTFKKTKMEKVA